MCGGVGFKTRNIPEAELRKHYSTELIKRFKKTDRIESFFWHKNAVLPVMRDKNIELMVWGNKNKEIKFPPTGWAREESLRDGKWAYLHPEPADIPVDSGYEKKTWFDFKNGTKGVVIERDGKKRVYMITKEASQKYENETGHGREPLGDKNNYEHELGTQPKLV
jgi:hypothetical protein